MALLFPSMASAAPTPQVVSHQTLDAVVGDAIRPIMAEHHIPGVAIGVVEGRTTRIFTYGVASKATRRPITRQTLFEIGSVSKTFTATLATLAAAEGRLCLSGSADAYMSRLKGAPLGRVTLLQLGTHTLGGMPLQLPIAVKTEDDLTSYLAHWRGRYAPGTYRTYNNPGIGTLGLITANALGSDFSSLVQRQLLPGLGLDNTFVSVPASRMVDYAQGYDDNGPAPHISDRVLSAETYGIKSSVGDMARYLQKQMDIAPPAPAWRDAIKATHVGYFATGGMTQDLAWEQYAWPSKLSVILAGNAPEVAFGAVPVRVLSPPTPPLPNVFLNKSGGTNGFATYVAFIPGEKLGVVILANKAYPIPERVRVAYAILCTLTKERAALQVCAAAPSDRVVHQETR